MNLVHELTGRIRTLLHLGWSVPSVQEEPSKNRKKCPSVLFFLFWPRFRFVSTSNQNPKLKLLVFFLAPFSQLAPLIPLRKSSEGLKVMGLFVSA